MKKNRLETRLKRKLENQSRGVPESKNRENKGRKLTKR